MIASLATSLSAAVYAFMPVEVGVAPVPPPLVLLDPNTTDVIVSLGANRTSSNVTVKAFSGLREITYNGDFDTGPDGWFFLPGTYLTNVAWLPSFLGASGVIEISGTLPSFTYDSAYILSSVSIPNTSISGLFLNVTYYVRRVWGVFHRLVVVLYDLDTSSVVWSSTTLPVTGGWDVASFTIPASSVVPGKMYYILAGFYAFNPIPFFPVNLSYYFDSVHLYVNLTNPSFGGVVLAGNLTHTQEFNAWLRLDDLTVTGNVNASIVLINLTGYASSPIEVSNNVVLSNETSPIEVAPSPPGYVSFRVILQISMEAGSSVNMTLSLIYSLGGVTATYPVRINVTDPPQVSGATGTRDLSSPGLDSFTSGLIDDVVRKLSMGCWREIDYGA